MLRHTMQRFSAAALMTCRCGRTLTKKEGLYSAVLHVEQSMKFSTTLVPRYVVKDDDPLGMSALQKELRNTGDQLPRNTREYQFFDEDGVVGVMDPSLNVVLPTWESHNMLVDGVPYKELPVAHIKASRNNTIITVTDARGTTILGTASGGTVGFKNAGKKSDVAAQTAGYAVGKSIRREGYKNVKCVIRGLGAGRVASVMGMKTAGINIISITDATVDQTSQKPRRRPHK